MPVAQMNVHTRDPKTGKVVVVKKGEDVPSHLNITNPQVLEEEVDYSEMKVEELKDALKDRDLEVSGTKDELVARLEADEDF